MMFEGACGPAIRVEAKPLRGERVRLISLRSASRLLLLLSITTSMTTALRCNAAELIDPTRADTNLTALTKVLQVRDLAPFEAARGFPVRVTGVVTYWDQVGYKQFLQDDSAGIYLDLNHLESTVTPDPGERTEVVGFTGPGSSAPIIHA